MNIINVFPAKFFVAAKLCAFSFVLVNLPFSVNAKSTNQHDQIITQTNNHANDILDAKKEEAHKKRRQLEQLTLTLAKQIKQNQNQKSQNQSNKNQTSANLTQLNDLIETAKSRQILLSELLELSPSAVKRSKLPNKILNHAPEQIKQYLLQSKELEGELEIFYEDYEQLELSRLRHVLKTKTGRIELHFSNTKSLSNLKHGSKVKAKGLYVQGSNAENSDLDSALIESQTELALLEDGASAAATEGASPAQLANTLGEQKTLVLLVNFQDNPTDQPWTKAEVQDMVFGTVSAFYRENSSQQTWLNGDVNGYLTLPINSSCDYGTIDSYAQLEARNNGIDVSSYDRLVYLFPKNNECGWRGQGTVGGTPSRTWLNGELNLLTIGHEIGHNFGLHHAKYMGCGSNGIDDTCISLEYGDNLDVMGKSTGHFNAFNKERLGWLNSDVGQIITADSDGTYLLEPYESTHAGSAKSLKVLRGTDSSSGDKLWYYLEYRQAIGFDSFLEDKAGITNGVLLHLNIGSDLHSSQLIDMTPNSTRYDLDDAALVVGNSYNDIDAGVVITTEWADQTGVSVNVVYSEKSCIKADPSLSLSPNESAWVEAGTSVIYSATVSNNDSIGCAASSYGISAVVPSGWATNSNSLNLAPGESGTVALNVASADTAIDGFYDITISAQNSNDNNYHNTGVVSYVVETPIEACVLASPLFTLSVDNSGELVPGTMATYQGTLTNQDSNSCADVDFNISANVPSGWSAESFSVNLAPGQSSNISLNVSSLDTANDGIYDFNIRAQNGLNSNYWTNDVASYIVASPLLTCVVSEPLIVVSNPQGGEVVAGTQVAYSATITNQDSDGCDETSFEVWADVTTKWNATNTLINLLPGASAVVNFSVTSNADASAGVYYISANIKNTLNSTYHASDIVSYEVKAVATPSNEAPVAVNDSVTMTSKEAIIIPVLANDWDPENDSLSISTVAQGAKGSVTITADGYLLYTPAKSFKSSDSFSYTVSDGDKTSSATVTLSLTSSGSGNKGRGKK